MWAEPCRPMRGTEAGFVRLEPGGQEPAITSSRADFDLLVAPAGQGLGSACMPGRNAPGAEGAVPAPVHPFDCLGEGWRTFRRLDQDLLIPSRPDHRRARHFLHWTAAAGNCRGFRLKLPALSAATDPRCLLSCARDANTSPGPACSSRNRSRRARHSPALGSGRCETCSCPAGGQSGKHCRNPICRNPGNGKEFQPSRRLSETTRQRPVSAFRFVDGDDDLQDIFDRITGGETVSLANQQRRLVP